MNSFSDEKDEADSPGSSPNNNRNSKGTSNSGKSPIQSESEKMECDQDTREDILPHAQTNDPVSITTLDL